MTRIGTLGNWLAKPPITGAWAIFWTVAALAVPTAIRSSVQGSVSGCESVPFIPSVMLAAMFLGWRYATVVALASALIADALYMGHAHLLLEGPCDQFGVAAFLITSAMIVGGVEWVRVGLARRLGRPGHQSGSIVFSLEGGQAWASWYGGGPAIHLGAQEEVAKMMEDFLAQVELGKYLAEKSR